MMYTVPTHPKIYHILHADRLASVLNAGGLWCDAEMQHRDGAGTTIGMNKIKQARLFERRVTCYESGFVGDYVPFYFCPRSIMLYVIAQRNNADLPYHEGQEPIIHLQADVNTTVAWAEAQK